MRLKEARIKPLADDMIGDEIRHQLGEQFKDQPVLNVFKTLGKSLKAYRRFMVATFSRPITILIREIESSSFFAPGTTGSLDMSGPSTLA